MIVEARTPVIVGVGEVVDRPADVSAGLEPIALMAEALRRAGADAGGGFLRRLDALDVVRQATWRYADIAAELAAVLNISPRHQTCGPIGGESAVRQLNDAALHIAQGSVQIAAICSGEAQHTLTKARKLKERLPWTPLPPSGGPRNDYDFLNPVALKHRMAEPAHVYPLYECATAAAWGQTPAQAQAESGELWAACSGIAADNPYSWSPQAYRTDVIITPSPANRMIAWPYTKRMVANPMVNMGAAVILTSLDLARAAGIPDHKLVYIWGGAAANEPRDYLKRDQYARSHAQEVVLEQAQAIMRDTPGGGDLYELYSCFPVVPKMARRTLGLSAETVPTVTGGLSFFGGPFNSYMMHAAAAMVRRLRDPMGRRGLLYGQGEYVTKHHALVLANRAPKTDHLSRGYDVQAHANARFGPFPLLIEDYSGIARIEASTVIFDREGAPLHGTIICRTEEGARLMARVAAGDTASMAILMSMQQSPVGAKGYVTMGADGLLQWSAGEGEMSG